MNKNANQPLNQSVGEAAKSLGLQSKITRPCSSNAINAFLTKDVTCHPSQPKAYTLGGKSIRFREQFGVWNFKKMNRRKFPKILENMPTTGNATPILMWKFPHINDIRKKGSS